MFDSRMRRIHYLEGDDVAACGTDERPLLAIYAHERVTCPSCRTLLGARDWAQQAIARIEVRKHGGGTK